MVVLLATVIHHQIRHQQTALQLIVPAAAQAVLREVVPEAAAHLQEDFNAL